MTSRVRVCVRVVAGALFDPDGRVLIAQRPAGKHLAGRWEFPGGKIGEDESSEMALIRELREEVGVEVDAGGCRRLMTLTHAYADREVELQLYVVERWRGALHALDGQALKWVTLAALDAEDILEADRPFIEALQRRGPPVSVDCTAAASAAIPAGV